MENPRASKRSGLDFEEVGKRETYVWKRVRRGEVKSEQGNLANAPADGAFKNMSMGLDGLQGTGISRDLLFGKSIRNSSADRIGACSAPAAINE
ncbi:MAG: hypothetical protein LBQ12_07515 [Deltaproteobacteria bacterium]|jgi:hypothetical protein|nr:hypothetical protein [Deltaproteobacteria bacterium]